MHWQMPIWRPNYKNSDCTLLVRVPHGLKSAIPLRRQPASPQLKPIRRPRKWTIAPTFRNLHRQILTLGRFPPYPLEDRYYSFL
jgi:hypothetical protein